MSDEITGFLRYQDSNKQDQLIDIRTVLYLGELGQTTSLLITSEGRTIKAYTQLQDLIDQVADLQSVLEKYNAVNLGPGILIEEKEERFLFGAYLANTSKELN